MRVRMFVAKTRLIAMLGASFYALLVSQPMIAYLFYKSLDNKTNALLIIAGAVLGILSLTLLYYYYFYPSETEIVFDISKKWRELEKK